MAGTNWTRLSERGSIDSIDTDVVMRVAAEIKRTINDRELFDVVIFKIARALVEREIDPKRFREICDSVVARRRTLKRPGAYFMASVKAEYARAGIPWRSESGGDR